ncbi:MAG: FAD-binding protein [Thermoleophilia bacterium]|nr:FAD-binding protein [Thermoleophilia bacterium]
MKTLDSLAEVLTTDVLIVGGGIGGLAAAINVKEAAPELQVLIAEKQTTGWAGKATKIGGFLAFLKPGDDADRFIDYQVRRCGFYLNDQRALTKYVHDTYRAIEQFAEWGARLARTQDGGLVSFPAFWAPGFSMTLIDIDLMRPMRARARKLGTQFLDKIHVAELLLDGDRVAGAVGFDIITGRFYVIKAKATILANGSCGYKVRRFWVAANGDGIAAAFRAGAEMRNAEFGNLYGHTVFQDTDSGMVGYMHLVNSVGENLAQKYLPDEGPAGVFLPIRLAVGIYKEALEGRVPIRFAPPPQQAAHRPEGALPKLEEWRRRLEEKERQFGLPDETQREIGVPLHGETSCIKVDHEMRTTLEGLWAIGDTSYAGSAVAGAMPAPPGVSPGSGIMFAVISAAWAGPSAAQYAAEASMPEIDGSTVEALKQQIFAPLERGEGVEPAEAISALQDVMAPMKYNLCRSKDRLEEGLARVQMVKEKLPLLRAKDLHYLSKCHEVCSMTLCAELTLRAALTRTESRGFHYREDYPETDNENWLKWVILRHAGGRAEQSRGFGEAGCEGSAIEVLTEPIPIEEYPIRPSE